MHYSSSKVQIPSTMLPSPSLDYFSHLAGSSTSAGTPSPTENGLFKMLSTLYFQLSLTLCTCHCFSLKRLVHISVSWCDSYYSSFGSEHNVFQEVFSVHLPLSDKPPSTCSYCIFCYLYQTQDSLCLILCFCHQTL